MRNAVSILLTVLVACGTLVSAAQDDPCSLDSCTISGYGTDQRFLWIPDLPGPVNERWFFEDGEGTFETFENGTAHIFGNTYNEDAPDHKMYIDFWFTDRMNWEEWSALGRSWKGDDAIVGDLYTTWDYYIMHPDSANRIEASGAWDGVLDVTHRPASYLYGLQVGEAANDKNGEHGMSCWFNYTGTLNGDDVEGYGDINGEGGCEPLPLIDCLADVILECGDDTSPDATGTPEVLCSSMALEYVDETSGECPLVITRTWTVTSVSGETESCTQTITVEDTVPPVFSAIPLLTMVDCEQVTEPQPVTADDACSGAVDVTTVVESLDFAEAMCGQFRTQTPGGWGSPANGNNPGTYRDANFDAAFPNGLTIGCSNTLTLTSAAAVEAFLPAGGTPSELPPGSMVDPTGYGNSLAQHLVALKLTLGFDAYDPNFAEAYAPMNELLLNAGAMAGTTLEDLITLADEIIGGCSSSASPSSMTDALATVNENYVDGTMDGGQVDCPYDEICGALTAYTYSATDACGNTSYAQQLIAVTDDSAPTILTDLESITVECGQVPEPFIEATDCGSGEVTWTVETNEFSGACLPTVNYVYTVTDACGNSTTASQFIAVVDTQAPVIANQPEDLVLACSEAIPPFTPEVTDNCAESLDVTLSESVEEIACGQVLTQTWTAMDGCGNTASVSRTITQSDDSGPQPVEPLEPITVTCTEAFTPVVPAFVDACSEVIDVQVEVLLNGEGCSYTGQYVWTAIDGCGQTTVIVQEVTVADTTAPVFADAPTSVALMCGEGLPEPNLQAIDDCSEVTLSVNDMMLPSIGCASWLRTYTATDACGNTATFEQYFNVEDNEAPVFNSYPEDVDGSCAFNLEPPVITATDNCAGIVEVSMSEVITPLDCGISVARTWTASDGCGNTASHTQTLNLTDSEPPIFSGDAVVNAACGIDPMEFISVTDDCDPYVELTYTDNTDGDFCSQTLTRVYTATDNCGNTSTFEQTLQITDAQPPVFVYVPEDVALGCADGIPTVGSPVVEDNCSDVTITLEEAEEGSGCQQLLRRTWTATDACGNQATAEQLVYIGDQLPPVLQGVPEDMALDCSANLPDPATVTAEDDCGAVDVQFMEEILPGTCANTYTVVRTWTATDGCGNTVTDSQTLTFTDTTPPVFDTQVEDIVAQCGMIPEPPMVSASDDCGAVNILFEETFETGGCPNIIRTWTAMDACGNAVQMVQSVQVEDNEPPVLEGIVSVVNTTCNNIPDIPDPEVSDNCDDDVAVTYTENVVGTGCEITIIRTWIASDDCGNTTVISQSVNLTDEEAPEFVGAPEDLTIECSDLDNVPFPNVIDDCGATVIMTYEDQPLGTGCTYDIQRTWTATDACGNSTSDVQLLHVIDQTPPILAGIPPNMAVSCENIPEPVTPVATDGCSGIASVDFVETQLGTGCSYTLQRTWTATDNCGNAISVARLLFVEDALPPYFVGVPDDINLACLNAEIPEVVHPVAMDNCSDNPTVNFVEMSEELACGELITRRWIAQDDCGNVTIAEQQITRADTEAPVLEGVPDPIQVSCDAIPAPATVTATDNCGDAVSVILEESVNGGVCPYVITRTWTAIDVCGNVAISTQQIEVTDNVAPVLVNVPEDMSVSCGELPSPAAVQAVDNCSDVSVMVEEEWLEEGCVSLLQRTYTAVDLCGNTAQHVQLIEVLDTEAPDFTLHPENEVIQCGDPQLFPQVEILDDCSGGTLVFDEVRLDTECASEYSLLRTWTAQDVCGNVASIQQVVEVVDSYAPVWPDAPEDLTVTCEEVPEIPEVVVSGECDDSVEIFYEETVTVLDDMAETECALGNAVTEFASVAIWLPGLPGGFGENYVFGEEGGVFTQDLDAGTAHITGQVYNEFHPEHSFVIDIYLEDRMEWAAWAESGGGYKDDYNVAGDLYQTWSFYKLSSESQLIGALEFEGTVLSLTHAPASYEFGFQVGEAANNRNAEWGMSGWFFYEGELQGIPVAGMGDVIVETACCADQDIVRTWTITDCAGNANTYTQLIEVRQDLPLQPVFLSNSDQQDAEDRNFDVYGSEGDWFRVAFVPEVDGDYSLTVCDESGHCVNQRELKGMLAGQKRVIALPKQGLAVGRYVFAVTGNDRTYTDRELVIR